MMAIAHALVGGAIASATTNNPALGVTLSLASHPLLDMVPHWDFGWGWRDKKKTKLIMQGSGDLLVGLILSYLFFGMHISLIYFLSCVFASLIWDLAQVPYWVLGWRFFPFSTIYKFQHELQGKAKLPWGILTQVVSVILIVLFLRGFS